jgi:hypothetical protein
LKNINLYFKRKIMRGGHYSDYDEEAAVGGGFEEEYIDEDYGDKPVATKSKPKAAAQPIKNDFWEKPAPVVASKPITNPINKPFTLQTNNVNNINGKPIT